MAATSTSGTKTGVRSADLKRGDRFYAVEQSAAMQDVEELDREDCSGRGDLVVIGGASRLCELPSKSDSA
jgi:hypothetical protein